MMQARKQGKRLGTSTCREALCPDVRRRILRKLSYRDHAAAALVCREFVDELDNRVPEERAASISLAEEAIGEAVFNAFVIAIQRLMCGLPPYPNCPLPLPSDLVIHASGEIGLKTKTDMYRGEQRTKEEGGAFIRKMGSLLTANLSPNIPGTCKRTWIALIFTEAPNTLMVNVHFTREAAVAARGLMLAICTGNPHATPSRWQWPLEELTLTDDGRDEARGRLSTGSEERVPPLVFRPHLDLHVKYEPGRDVYGERAKVRNARCQGAARAVAAAGNKGWGREWHGEGLGLCAFLLIDPTS